MINAIERQGMHSLLRTTNERRELKHVQKELRRPALVIDGSPKLSDTPRSRGRVLTDRRALIARLLAGRVAPATERLASRAAAAHARTIPLTLTSYLALVTDLTGERMAQVTVARPLDERRAKRLHRALEAQVGGPVLLQITVSGDVIDGMGIDLGAHVFESTVAGRLDEAHRLLS